MNEAIVNAQNLASPIEATDLGNIMIQLKVLGEIGSLKEMREVVRCSNNIIEYLPVEREIWCEA